MRWLNAGASTAATLAIVAAAYSAAGIFYNSVQPVQAPPRSAADVHVIHAGHVLDVTTMAIADDVTLIIQDGFIRSRHDGPFDERLDTGAMVIDLSAYTVLAGMIDTHVHLTLGGDPDENARVTVAAGFTTVVDLGSVGGAGVRLQERVTKDSLPGPTIIAAGSWIGAPGGVCDFGGATVRGQVAAAARARADVLAGAGLLKVCVTGWSKTALAYPDSIELSGEELAAVRAVADSAGVPVIAHAIGQRGAILAVQHGARLLAHTPLVDSAAAARLARAGTCVATTLSTVPDGALRTAVSDALLRLRRSGVRIVLGTDAGVLKHGINATEMLALRSIGFRPEDVLRSATSTAAECLALPGYGRLRAGDEASLIAVDGNPLQDLMTLQRPVFVMRRGQVMSQRGAQSAPIERQTLLPRFQQKDRSH